MFNKFKSAPNNATTVPEEAVEPVAPEEIVLVKEEETALPVALATPPEVTPNVLPSATQQRGNGVMGMFQANVSKPSIQAFYPERRLLLQGRVVCQRHHPR